MNLRNNLSQLPEKLNLGGVIKKANWAQECLLISTGPGHNHSAIIEKSVSFLAITYNYKRGICNLLILNSITMVELFQKDGRACAPNFNSIDYSE